MIPNPCPLFSFCPIFCAMTSSICWILFDPARMAPSPLVNFFCLWCWFSPSYLKSKFYLWNTFVHHRYQLFKQSQNLLLLQIVVNIPLTIPLTNLSKLSFPKIPRFAVLPLLNLTHLPRWSILKHTILWILRVPLPGLILTFRIVLTFHFRSFKQRHGVYSVIAINDISVVLFYTL